MTKIVSAAEIDISVKGGKSLNELNKELKEARENLDQVGKESGETSEEFKKAENRVNGLSSSIDNLEKEANQSGKAMKKVGSSAKVMKGGLDKANNSSKMMQGNNAKLGGGLESLGGAFGGAARGAAGLGKQLLALMANPIVLLIVAIVGALAGLFKAFISTKEGGEKFDAVMDGISATIDVVRDRVLKIGGAIVKFFTGDWKGALDDAKGAVSGFGEEVKREFEVARQASLKLAEIKDRMRDLSVERAKQNLEISRARELSMDETKSLGARLEAVKKAGNLESELETKNVQVLKEKLDTLRKINAQSDTSSEDLEKEASAEIALYQAQQSAADARLRLQREEKRLRNEAAAAYKARMQEAKRLRDEANKAKAAEKKEKERVAAEKKKKAEEALKVAQEINAKAAKFNDDFLKDKYQKQLDNLNENFIKQKKILESQKLETDELEEKYYTEKTEIEIARGQEEFNREQAKRDKEKKAREKDKQDEIKSFRDKWAAKEAIQQNAYGVASQFSNLIGELGQENIKVQKAQALIQIGIDTASAISSLVKMSQANIANATTGGVAGALQFASGMLQITANIAKAVNILGASSPDISSAQSNIPSNNPDTSPNFSQSGNSGQDRRIYVLETDISTAQKRVTDLSDVGIVQ